MTMHSGYILCEGMVSSLVAQSASFVSTDAFEWSKTRVRNQIKVLKPMLNIDNITFSRGITQLQY